MAVGNKRNMITINSNKVLNYVHEYCEKNNTNIGALGEALGHSTGYVYASCRNGKFPLAELKLLCMQTGLSMKEATSTDDEAKAIALTTEEKLDYIVDMLESLIDTDTI